MKLLDDIVSILSDSKGSLTDALLKTKVLLFQLGRRDLVPWVNSELTGYSDPKTIPPYRKVRVSPHASLNSFRMVVKDWRLPTGHLTDKQREFFSESWIDMSIQNIEQSVKRYHDDPAKSGLHRPVDPAYASLFNKVLEPGVAIISIWCDVSMIEVAAILDEVRSRLLDFALELRAAIGDTPERDLPRKAEEVQAGRMFNNTIFNTGSGNVYVGGAIQVNNTQGDIEGLLNEVGKLGYDKAALDELRQAVQEDQKRGEKPSITEGETAKWYMKALKGVGKGAVDVAADVVTKVAVEALKAFTGV